MPAVCMAFEMNIRSFSFSKEPSVGRLPTYTRLAVYESSCAFCLYFSFLSFCMLVASSVVHSKPLNVFLLPSFVGLGPSFSICTEASSAAVGAGRPEGMSTFCKCDAHGSKSRVRLTRNCLPARSIPERPSACVVSIAERNSMNAANFVGSTLTVSTGSPGPAAKFAECRASSKSCFRWKFVTPWATLPMCTKRAFFVSRASCCSCTNASARLSPDPIAGSIACVVAAAFGMCTTPLDPH
mmetsp:Transcript_26738/g.44353  ORF Transcript_26738/g.44353 Transcript_26738/m.44353 type:complete len:240 (-) Transcript_26738:309-1028(-)